MNICRIRNWMAKYTAFVVTGDNDDMLEKEETDLISFFFWTCTALFVTVMLAWWMIPGKMIHGKITRIKFKCNMKR